MTQMAQISKMIALMPFYLRSATTSHLIMCVSKKHLHGHWSIQAFVNCLRKKNISIPFKNYDKFFEYVTAECKSDKVTREHMLSGNPLLIRKVCVKLSRINNAMTQDDGKTNVNLQYFVSIEKTLTNGSDKKNGS